VDEVSSAPPVPGLVSVVICAYDNWPDLELAIASALCQSHRPIEVIVVDNSSTDATAREVPARFGGRVSCIRQPNRGDSGAYNTGFAASRGEFVQFLDGDDILAPNKIEKQLAVFRAHPDADVVFGDVRYFRGLAGVADWTDFDSSEDDVGMEPFLRHEGRCVGAVLAVLFRRATLERIGKWDESIYVSDSDYELRAILAGCRYRRCEGSPMSFKRVRPGQMGTNTVAMLDGAEALWTKALGLVENESHREGIRRNLARTRFWRAFRADDMSTRQALAKCREARATCARAVPLPAYLAAMAIIVMPGGRFLAASPRVRSLRRAVARLCGYRISA
jgi:glycosyltransferase involved in cell wall biosynthesis